MSEEKQQTSGEVILSVRNLTIDFRSDEGFTQAVRGVSFDLKKGETLCIVGESGSGKSVSCKTIMGILPGSAIIRKGSVMYRGEDLTKISEEEFHRIRGNLIGMIFQDPLSALDPIVRIGKQITESMMVNANRLKIRRDNLTLRELSHYNSIVSEVKKAKAAIKVLKADRAEIKKFKETSAVNIDYRVDDLHAANAERLALHPEEKEALERQERELRAQLSAERQAEIEKRQASLKERKAQAKANYRQVKKDSKAPKREAAKALRAARKRADAEIRTFKRDSIAEYKHQRDLIESRYPKEEIEAEYRKAKKAFESEARRIDSERKVELAKISAKRALRNSGLAAERKEVNIAFDQKRKEAYERLLKAAEDRHNERQAKLDENFFHNYCEKIRYTRRYAKARAIEVMTEVGIPQAEKRFRQYPFEFSGGMRQRIVIAIALTANPEILICDEPTTALDVTIQAQILELINRLKKERNMSVIFITHDMGVVAEMADRICVMYAGKIVEFGTAYDIFYNPKHPYTWALLSSIPDLDSKEKLEAIPGTPPNMNFPPEGDAFALRSKYAMAIDFKQMPPFFKVSKTHYAATWLLDPRAPKAEMPRIVSRRIEISLNKAGVTYEQLERQEESD